MIRHTTETEYEAALKAAREFHGHSNWSVLCPDRCIACHKLADIIIRERAAAVEQARPKLESARPRSPAWRESAMPKPHAAAVNVSSRWFQAHEVSGVMAEDITREYQPLIDALVKFLDCYKYGDGCEPFEVRAAMRKVVGDE
jgi:hypothetical protein